MSFSTDMREDAGHIATTTRFELIKHLRRKRLVMALLLAVILPLIFLIIPRALGISYPKLPGDFLSMSLGFVYLLVIICGALFAGDAVSSEFDKRTCLFSFTLPQRRTSMFAGKYLAAFLATGLMISLYYIIAAAELIGIYGITSIPGAMATSYLVALLYTLSVISFMFFFSCLIKSNITATLLGFFTLFMILPIISSVLMFSGKEPWYLLTYNAELITSVFGSVPNAAIEIGRGQTLTIFSPTFIGGCAVVAAYAVILYALGMLIGSRKEVQ